MSDPAPVRADDRLDWSAVGRGVLMGLAVVVPVTILRAVLDREVRDFDDSGWVYPLFLLILVAYFLAGWVASRARPDAPLTYGGLAGVGVLAAWLPIRVVIWAVREDDRPLFSGEDAALRPGQVFGALVIATALGMAGGWLGERSSRRTDARTDPPVDHQEQRQP